MGWKDWPYWLKGLLILGILTFIVIFGLQFKSAYRGDFSSMKCPSFSIREDCNFYGYITSGWVWFTILFYIIPSALLGALIGWIYGKIKSKSQK